MNPTRFLAAFAVLSAAVAFPAAAALPEGLVRVDVAFEGPATQALTVSARVYSASGTLLATIPFSVPRASFLQVAVAGWVPSVADGIVGFEGASGSYAAYMVVNDNVSNDANFQLATGW